MKTDRNHIDDFFKEGLEGFSEVPRRSVWKQISGKLLWREIAHLNFSNVPALWTGVAATSLVVIALAIFIPGYLSDDQSAQVIQNEQTSPASRDAETMPSIKNPETLPEKSSTATDPLTGDQNPASGQTGAMEPNEIENLPPENKPTNPEKGTKEQPIAEKVSPATPEAAPERQQAIEQQKEEIEVANNSVNQDKNQPERTTLKPAEAPETAKETAWQVNKIETVEMVQPGVIQKDNLQETVKSDQPEELPVTVSGDMLPGQTDSEKTGPGKIQKMHSLSFSIGQFLKGKYRAPKRSYTESTMNMYRGTNTFFSASVYVAPEVTEYTRPASSSMENNYLIGAAAAYHTSRYMVQAGVEVSYFNDLGDYMVNMSTFDSVGYYHGIGGFVIDPENPDSVIFQTHTVTVWDSVEHHSHQQTRNQYTYLQFPVLFGYKAMESGIFSAHIKAGPSFSFLLNKQEPNLNFSRPDATIQGIDNYTLPRLNTSIQVLVSLSLQFQITEQLGILAEPTYRYYINPVYDVNGESLKNPYSIGVRGGIYFNF